MATDLHLNINMQADVKRCSYGNRSSGLQQHGCLSLVMRVKQMGPLLSMNMTALPVASGTSWLHYRTICAASRFFATWPLEERMKLFALVL